MSKKKLCLPVTPPHEKIYNERKNLTGIQIGITYLDTTKYGIKELFKESRGKNQYLDDFNSFLEKARELNDIGTVIKAFISHKHSKNDDIQSQNKVNQLNHEYHLEVDHLIHLHCKFGGNGEFVIHGFQLGNTFEIVWLDPKHSVHPN